MNHIAVIRAFVTPFVYLGPAWLRRKIVDMIPAERVQRMKNITDTMFNKSVQIINEKKAAIEHGDEAVLQQVGEGKDVMSILRVCRQTEVYSAN